MSFPERLASFKEDGESLREFCKRINKPVNTVRAWLKGFAMPDEPNLSDVAESLNTTTLWLRYGDGPKGRSEYERLMKQYRK